MSGFYVELNEDIANSFIKENEEILSPKQIKVIKNIMQEGESSYTHHSLFEGSKRIFRKESENPIDQYEYDVVIATIEESKTIIYPSGDTKTVEIGKEESNEYRFLCDIIDCPLHERTK